MTTTIISTNPQYTFGQMTNRLVSGMVGANTNMERLATAIASASSGYDGVPGTQFEISNAMGGQGNNLFGVVADPDEEGKKGQDYAYAIGRLNELWTSFWTQARPFIEQLDNGQTGM